MPISRQYTPPTRRDQRVKQDTRVWYNYLQTALYHDYKVNKEFYKLWHLSKVKKQKFVRMSLKVIMKNQKLSSPHETLEDTNF